jgi:methylglutamate dehydrogenase subunit D
MPEVRSALPGRPTVQGSNADSAPAIEEVTARDLLQVAGWTSSFDAMAMQLAQLCECPVPRDTLSASTAGATTMFRVAPERLWVAAPVERNLGAQLRGALTSGETVVTELGHSRTIIRVRGPRAADLLARFIAIDLADREFPVGRFAQTSLLHTGTLVHRTAGDDFDLYVPRSYALSIWEVMTAAAELLPGSLA